MEKVKQGKNPISSNGCNGAIMAIHDVMDLLNGKWKVSIIACLCFDKMRYSDLLKNINGISGKMLSRDLKDLETHQLITRTVLNTQPVTVEYALTEYGGTLKKVTEIIADWGFTHRKKMMRK